MLVCFELLLILAIVTMGFALPPQAAGWARGVRRGFRWLARHRRLAVLAVGATSLALNVTVGLLRGIPYPCTTDEFSYLLASDTFSQGRLTNSTHPLHEHFAATRIIQTPTYQSKFPPGQGLVLAAGQVLFGDPIFGVWMSVAVGCAAVCWMLQAWLPARWALLGGFYAAANTGIVTWWGQTYWGGAVAMTGGALLFGALRRIFRDPRMGDSFILGLGIALLANSRPYEGLLASLPATGVMAWWIVRQIWHSAYAAIARAVIPIGLSLVATFGAMAYYNARVAGDPLLLPYQISQDYPISAMIGSTPKLANVPFYLQKLQIQWVFYIRVLLLPPLLLLPLVLKNRWMRFAALTCFVVMTGMTIEMAFGFPHYTAPIAGLVFAIVLQGLRHLNLWKSHGRAVGAVMVTLLPAAYLLSLLAFYSLGEGWYPEPNFCEIRAQSMRELDQKPGKQLVIVRYAPDHHPSIEWVYNRADIDGAKVVWARSLGKEQDDALLSYFADRRAWLLFADERPIRVVPIRREPKP